MKTILEKVFETAKRFPNKIAISDGKNSFTYSRLIQNIIYAKNVLENTYHLSKGDCIILAASKELNFVAVYFASHLIGSIVVPIDPETNETRFNVIYKKVSPKLIVGFSRDVTCELCNFDFFNNDNSEDYKLEGIEYPELKNVADIIFTTGTTGAPKGVTLTQENISAAALNINTFIQNSENDVEMLALPISHSFGLGRLRCTLSNGQTLILLGSFANMKRFFRFMEEFGVSGFGMVPASWAMLKKLSGDKIKNFVNQLKYIEIGSAPMAIEDKKLLCELLPNTRICMHYGLTEASRSAFIEFNSEKQFLNSVGKQSPNMNIYICDENGNKLPLNTEGEICVEGLAVTHGYYLEDSINQDSFWNKTLFRTGDWGELDNDGYIYLKSRKKELINVGGKKVSPVEVESVLIKIDFIKDCACVAIADKNNVLGEVVKAFIVTDNPELITVDNLNNMIGKQLENYKIPVEYEIINEIPKTSSGKIQRLALKTL